MTRPTAPGRRAACAALLRTATLGTLAVLAGCGSGDGAPRAGAAVPLVVLITVDQMRGDYLERFADQLTGGLARVRGGSAYFPNARQNHAVTQTAPGHATLLSGRWPARVGILSNDSGVPDPRSPLVGSRGPGASPHRFLGTALYDWLVAADPRLRVLSVSRKDRGAILPVGRARGDVYWWDDGRFTTSRWYAEAVPDWVTGFNARFRPEAWYGREWNLLLPEEAYPEPDDVPWEAFGASAVFPHVLPLEREAMLTELERFPWMDSLTLAFALEGVEVLGLGRRNAPELLVVSLSTLDGVGHRWGPDSREVRDHVLRLDRWLGAFLDSLSVLLPGPPLIAFSSDHGVSAIPEIVLERGGTQAGRVDLAALVRASRPELELRHGSRFDVALASALLLADTSALRAAGVSVDSLAEALAEQARELEGVRRVFTPASLAAAPDDDPDAGAWKRSIPPHVGWLVAATPEPGYYVGTGRSAQHGPPTPDNMSVPVAFLGPGIEPGRHERPIDTVDVAATLAALLGLTPLEALDGAVLREVVEGASGGG